MNTIDVNEIDETENNYQGTELPPMPLTYGGVDEYDLYQKESDEKDEKEI